MSSSSLHTAIGLPLTQGAPRSGDPALLQALEFLQLELTNQCNLKCVHCYSESAPHTGESDALKMFDYQLLIQDGYSLGARSIQFLGGEPTLNRDLVKLIDFAKTVGYEQIEVYSNLSTHVSPELIDYACRTGVRFATSFHSCDEVREDTFTGVKGSYQRKLRNLNAILARDLPVRGTIMIQNQPEEDIEATFEFAQKLGLRSISADRIRNFGRARGHGAADVSELCGNCWKGSLAISANGTAYACPFARDWPVGNVTETSLSEILWGVALKSIRHRVFDVSAERKETRVLEACGPCGPCGPSGCGPCGPCGPSGCGPCGPCGPSG
jgi:MoaA/NifB/PqqE/SkfB family radical SAM enzyme